MPMSVSSNTYSQQVGLPYVERTDARDSSYRKTRCIDHLSINKVACGIFACLAVVFICLTATSLLPQSVGYRGATIFSLIGVVLASLSYLEHAQGEGVETNSPREEVETNSHREEIKIHDLLITGVIVDVIINYLGDDPYTLNSLSELTESPLKLSDYVNKPRHKELIRAYKQEVRNLKHFFTEYFFKEENTSSRTIQPVDIFGGVDSVLRYPILPLLSTPEFRASTDGGYRLFYTEPHFSIGNSPEEAIIKEFEETDARVFRSDMYTPDPEDAEDEFLRGHTTDGCIVFYGKITSSQHVIP